MTGGNIFRLEAHKAFRDAPQWSPAGHRREQVVPFLRGSGKGK